MNTTPITSRQNQKVAMFRALMRERKARLEAGVFAAEGEKLFREAVTSGLKPENMLITDKFYKNNAKFCEYAANLCSADIISDDLAEYISDTKSPQGVFFTLGILDKCENSVTIYNSRRVIALDGVQDPANVGAIIRSADAFGRIPLLLSMGTADINSPKVIRSAMGSAFRLPVYRAELTNALCELKERGFVIVGAALSQDAEKLGDFAFAEKCVIIIGSEGQGISPEVTALCDKKIYIPIQNAESLNAAVAASIIIYELQKGE